MYALKKLVRTVVATVCVALVTAMPLQLIAAPAINDAVAIGDLKQAKGVFLLDFKDVWKTELYLKLIKGTRDRFRQQGVESELVLVFIGPTVQHLMTSPPDVIAMEYEEQLASISSSIAELKKLGVRMEVCNEANILLGVSPDELQGGLSVVSDGAISLIGWQYQGYKLVPLF